MKRLGSELRKINGLCDDFGETYFLPSNIQKDIKTRKDKIKYIIVGDNPGQNEIKYQEYLSSKGRAGKNIREFFDFEECFIFNKTPIYTNQTHELKVFFDENKEEFNEIQNICATTVIKIAKILGNVKIIIIGNGGGIFDSFFDEISKETENLEIYQVPHFSFNKAFMKNSNKEWNRLIDNFIKRNKKRGIDVGTKKGNLSSVKIIQNNLQKDFVEQVLLKPENRI